MTGLAVAGGLIFGVIKVRRKKSRVRKTLEKSKEETKRLSEQGDDQAINREQSRLLRVTFRMARQ